MVVKTVDALVYYSVVEWVGWRERDLGETWVGGRDAMSVDLLVVG